MPRCAACACEGAAAALCAPAKMAEALKTSTETLLSYLALPAVAPMARARKSAVKPVAPEKVSFERVLQDAGVDEQRISNLLREE